MSINETSLQQQLATVHADIVTLEAAIAEIQSTASQIEDTGGNQEAALQIKTDLENAQGEQTAAKHRIIKTISDAKTLCLSILATGAILKKGEIENKSPVCKDAIARLLIINIDRQKYLATLLNVENATDANLLNEGKARAADIERITAFLNIQTDNTASPPEATAIETPDTLLDLLLDIAMMGPDDEIEDPIATVTSEVLLDDEEA